MLLAAACLALAPAGAHAQDIDPQARAAARTLVQEGDELWTKGDFAGALDRFTRAYGLVNAPTIAIRQAECLEKLGRLVEASEKYMAVSRRKLGPGAPDAFKRAVATALERVEGVRARLAMLELTIEGENVADAKVFVDEREIPPALVGATFPVDPGERVVKVVKGSREVSEKIALEEKEKKTLTLTLPPGQDEPEPEPPPPPTAGTTQPPAPPPEQPPAGPGTEPTTSNQATWGWVSLGVGAAGLVAGGATGLIAMGKRNTLDDTCLDGKCPPSDQDDVDSYNQMRTFSTIGFGVGIVGVGAGLTLLLTAPDPEPSDQAGLRPWVGVGSAGVEGTF